MARPDPFTLRRIHKLIEDHRAKTGVLPTLQDFEKGGIAREVIDAAVRAGELEQLYVTLTNGTIVKGYKVRLADDG
jgi:hypothetical protein